jgi:adenosylhomocysteine nucleosidase
MYVLPMKIAVLGAFRLEVERIGNLVAGGNEILQAGCLKYVVGSGGARSILVGTTGMGKVRAAAAVQSVIDLFQPGLILVCGTAGALSDRVRPLDLVVAERVLQHDTGPKEPEWIPLDPPCLKRLDAASREAIQDRPHGVLRGGLVTGDRPVLDRRERKRLSRRFDALAVDMEAGAIAAVASAHGIPLAVVKAITDSADGRGIKDFKKHVHPGTDLAQKAVARLLDL